MPIDVKPKTIAMLANLFPLWRDDLALLSPEQVTTLRIKLRTAIDWAKRRKGTRGRMMYTGKLAVARRRNYHKKFKTGRPITSKHPRAAYWREWKRKRYAATRP